MKKKKVISPNNVINNSRLASFPPVLDLIFLSDLGDTLVFSTVIVPSTVQQLIRLISTPLLSRLD